MCARFTARASWEELAAFFGLGGWAAVPLAPFPPEEMRARRVGAFVNRPQNDDPRCVAPPAAG